MHVIIQSPFNTFGHHCGSVRIHTHPFCFIIEVLAVVAFLWKTRGFSLFEIMEEL